MIPIEEHNNIYIKVPVSLEQHFVEGSYNRILQTKVKVPLQCYEYFVNKFVDAIRVEVARSAEQAYESLSLKDLSKLLMIQNQGELLKFV